MSEGEPIRVQWYAGSVRLDIDYVGAFNETIARGRPLTSEEYERYIKRTFVPDRAALEAGHAHNQEPPP